MSEKAENGDWDENRKLVLQSLKRLERRSESIEANSKGRHDTVVGMLHSMEKTLEGKYVTKEEFNPVNKAHVTKKEFEPISKIVYGMAGLILASTLLAIIGIVLTRGAV